MNVNWAYCHHGIARPQLTEGRERPKIPINATCKYIEIVIDN